MLLQTLKGFRDFLPTEAKKRLYVINRLRQVFESYGFELIETPALEYEELLLGKYGEEGDKLMYRFEDNGKRKVAMRYDQTVPLARFVAEHGATLPMPFKRYQIQPVWRAENTQKGRYREFIQCDVDTVGVSSSLADAEIIALTATAFQKLGFANYKILINDRILFKDLSIQTVMSIDKLKKIGKDGVCKELMKKNIAKTENEAKKILQSITDHKPTKRLEEIFAVLHTMDIPSSRIEFSPTLARGLEYYTGMIFEVECSDYPVGSLAGGGRYDSLIGSMFTSDIGSPTKNIPAVGLALGFDRIIEAMQQIGLFPQSLAESTTKILVTIFNKACEVKSLEIFSQLQSNNIASEIYLDPNAKMEKQLKYADQKNIPYVIIIGSEEIKTNMVTLKNLGTREQELLSLTNLLSALEE